MSALKQALLAVRELRAQVAEAKLREREAIAIVGASCRFPGQADGIDRYWQILREGVDAITEVPKDRWDVDTLHDPDPSAPGKVLTRNGGFIENVFDFDAERFRISPREALAMDPQQRLILELAWNALEDAGIAPDSLDGSASGVFLGIGLSDYGRRQFWSNDPSRIDAYGGTGTFSSIAAGRIAYTLGLMGPTLAVDTACSSSLVALHLACQSLRSKESNLCLVGGVNLLLSPEPTIYFSRLQALSPDGRCKTFDASANGYARGEGAGVIVLKRLSDAQASRDRILAVIKGTAINQDGKSNGLTAPSAKAQEQVIRSALAAAELEPQDIDYIEAHGTGTPLGDPIEVDALGRVFGSHAARSEPLALGSVKTNIGHLEPAAGIAGLLKALLVVRNRHVPPHLHLSKLNPRIDLSSGALAIYPQGLSWDDDERPLRAGVSSFGLSGTNAHVILESAPQALAEEGDVPSLIRLSAPSAEQLTELAGNVRECLTENSLADICRTLALGRAEFPFRLALPIDPSQAISEQLANLPDTADLEASAAPTERVLTLHGAASAWLPCIQFFAASEPHFVAKLDAMSSSLVDELALPDPPPKAICSGAVALLELWSEWGITADSCRSSGWSHAVAAVATGTLDIEDALALLDGKSPASAPREPHTLWLDAKGDSVRWSEIEEIFRDEVGPDNTPLALDLNGTALSARSQHELNQSLASLYNAGHRIHWSKVFESRPGHPCSLPPTPFRRQHFELPHEAPVHSYGTSLFGERLNSPLHIHQSNLTLHSAPALGEHQINGEPLLPAAAMILMALNAKEANALVDIQLGAPLPLSEAPRLTHTAWLHHSERDEVQLASADPSGTWHRHLGAKRASAGAAPTSPLSEFRSRGEHPLDPQTFYQALRSRGLQYGPTYQRIIEITLGEELAIGRVAADSNNPAVAGLDACFQLLAATYPLKGEQAYIPVSIDRFTLYKQLDGELWVVAQRTGDQQDQVISGNLTVFNEAGEVLAQIDGFVARCVSQTRIGPTRPDWRYEHRLLPLNGPPKAIEGDVTIVQTEKELAQALHSQHVVLDLRQVERAEDAGGQLLRAIQLLVSSNWKGALWLHTNDHRKRPSQAAVWSMGRCLQLEHPELSIRLFDGRELISVWDAFGDERQVIETDEGLKVYRLQQATGQGIGTNRSILLPPSGDLDDIAWRHQARRPPLPGEVELEVRAAGLNFRDVLNALGAYPGDAGQPGGECSGVVRRIGEGVEGLRVGQRVMAMADGCFQSFMHVPAYRVVPIPDPLSDTEAATLPVAYLTAWWALERCAALKPGERVLIHAVSGGVGMAAAQIALARGAIVYGTASQPKWEAVKAWGVERVYSSRDLSFADAIHADTGGEGVHVVLNSLSGDFIAKSLGLLQAGGRFVEIGKRGIWSAERMSEAREDVEYTVFDLAQVAVEQVDAFRATFERVSAEVATGALKPLPQTQWPIAEVSKSFRVMARAEHVGKNVLVFPRAVDMASGPLLITGGLGGVGLQLAKALLDDGASEVILAGRRKANTSAESLIAEWRAQGHAITVVQLDVTDPKAVSDFMRGHQDLCGVIHGAGILDDGPAMEQTQARLTRLLEPKLSAARCLDAHMPRGAWLALLSSAAASLGNRHQTTYAAANAAMESIVFQRRERDEQGFVFHFGPWEDTGMTEGLSKALLESQGIHPLAPTLAARSFTELLSEPSLGQTLIDLTWSALLDSRPDDPTFAAFRESAVKTGSNTASSASRAQLIEGIREQARRVLGFDSTRPLPSEQPLQELGLDSLMSIELRNKLNDLTGQSLPATLLFDYPTIQELVDHLAPAEKVDEPKPTTLKKAVDEPIAIVGVACRFPGSSNSPQAYWNLLREGVDAVTEIPADRWNVERYYDPDPEVPGKMRTRNGAFVDDVREFDAGFFGISPREAAHMDPQQRMLLELSWEALERAGQGDVKESRTGVWLGICSSDYSRHHMFSGALDSIGAYSGIGSVYSVAAGRISYSLGLKGPALAVDTACSSSLVAAHMAVRSLRSGETDRALVAGVNLMLTPESTVYFSKLNALSPDGRCKTFDASADGYGRGEGCGVLVLKRLSDAQADGDHILALIRGSAVNQDGRSAGLTAPNGPSQQAVIREALADAGVQPAHVSYVEAHGTGTPLGDPIEVQAVGAALSDGRTPENPVLLGSVKTNIGHTEGAAGVAGLIKLALMLEHDALVPHLHFDAPSQHIPWNRLPVEVCTEHKPWPGTSRVCGISSFGLSGTNAHLILDAAPTQAVPASPEGVRPLVVSAHTEGALRKACENLEHYLSEHPKQWLQIAYTTNALRLHHKHRLALVADNAKNAREAIKKALEDESTAIRTTLPAETTEPQVAFLFTGQGSQYPGMGAELYRKFEAFRVVIDRCDALFQGREHGLKEVVFGSSEHIHDTAYTQPALFAFQVGLAAVWRSFGVEATAMLGHSIGELSAAHLAGVFDFEDGFRLVCERGRLMSALPRAGSMVALSTSESDALKRIQGREELVTVAVINGPTEVVVAGESEAVDAVAKSATADGIKTKKLTVSHAFHSPLMEPMLEAFREVARGITYNTPSTPIASNLTGKLETQALCDPEYWVRHVRHTVRFPDGVHAIRKFPVRIEIGPRPTLTLLGQRCDTTDAEWIPTVTPGENEEAALMRAVATAAAHNIPIAWNRLDAFQPLPLPTLPFQRETFWLERPEADDKERPLEGCYHLAWEPTVSPAQEATPFLLIGDKAVLEECRDELLLATIPWSGSFEGSELLLKYPKAHVVLDLPEQLTARQSYAAALNLCQAALTNGQTITLCTRGATTGDNPEHATVWGLGRTLQAEQPDLRLQLIDRDNSSLPAQYLGTSAPSQVQLRGSIASVPRLRALTSYPGRNQFDDRPILITGGYGSLGLALAEWLCDQGATNLFLAGRSGPSSSAKEVLATLQSAERSINILTLDVADRDAVNTFIETHPNLQAIFHAAGTLDDALLPDQQLDRFDQVAKAKVLGARNLDAASRGLNLESFVLFGSAAAVIGSPGQSNYAAANAYLDAVAQSRRALGLAACSVAFGPWSDSTMAAGVERDLWSRRGITPSLPSVQLERLGSFLSANTTSAFTMDANWTKLVEHQGYVAEVLKDLVEEPEKRAGLDLTQLPARTRLGALLEAVEREAQNVLGLKTGLDHDLGLFDAGFDSLMAVEFARRLERTVGRKIPTTLAFEHGNIRAIAEWLNGELSEDLAKEAPEDSDATGSPIAIIGVGCRFPGEANNAEQFWANLIAGLDSVGTTPSDRWDVEHYFHPERGQPGKTYTKRGAFLRDVKSFDASFFGISPREAQRIDPQQRLLLEVSWEALEDARISASAIQESPTGIFVGVAASDYMQRIHPTGQTDSQDMYSGTGNDSSFTAGRIAYVLGTHGPAMAVNTACSSSLVATHLACQSLRMGECRQALVAGVNLMLSPEPTVYLSQLGALSPQGRCATFDASADGYVRGEGCGVVVLKRLEQAKADGDSIIAVIRGSAINHDGPSSGLTVPNGSAQRALMRSALRNAQVEPNEVHYIEAHGTGTSLGDPIEVAAIGSVYGGEDHSVYLGSVKTNIGHLEAGAGIAGLIKAALAVQRRTIPPQVHFNELNPNIATDFSFTIPTAPTPWPEGAALAGLSSFGLSGTNAHLIVGEPPPPVQASDEERTEIIPISAKNAEAFQQLVASYKSRVPHSGSLGAIARTAATGRAHFAVRSAVVTSSNESLVAALENLGTPTSGPSKAPKVAFLFTGQGSQYPGMGRALYERFPLYRQHIDQCDEQLGVWQGFRLKQVLFEEHEGEAPIHDTGWTQPALFSLQVGLALLFKSWGVEADVVIGHSIGELSAACVAGMLSVEDGLSLVAARGQLMSALPREGAMAAIFADEATVVSVIGDRQDVGIAALNGPTETVISGSTDGVASIVSILEQQGVEHRPLTVSHAFHSHLMEPMLEPFQDVAAKLRYAEPSVQIISNVDARYESQVLRQASYWRDHVRSAVRFADGVQAVCQSEAELLIELGPQPVLTGMVSRIRGADSPHTIFTMRRGKNEIECLFGALASCYKAKLPIRWKTVYPADEGPSAKLPSYPFQRTEHWIPFHPRTAKQRPTAEQVQASWLPAAPPSADLPSGKWLVLADEGGLTAPFTQLLGPSRCELLQSNKAASLSTWLGDQLDDDLAGILFGWSADIATVDDLEPTVRSLLTVLQALSEGRVPPLLILTRPEGDSMACALQQGMWSVARTAALELPNCPIHSIALQGEVDAERVLEACAAEVEFEHQWLEADYFNRRILSARVSEKNAEIKSNGCYLITGGLGALGIAAAQWLCGAGAGKVILTSRNEPKPEVQNVIDSLNRESHRVEVALGDISRPEDLKGILNQIGTEHSLLGIIHAAGLLDDGMLHQQTWDRFARVMQPKVLGTLELLNHADNLDFILLYSSAASLFGSKGQANYAFANGVMDGLASYARAHGLPATSVQWGAWDAKGMAADQGSAGALRREAHGLGALPLAKTGELLERALRSDAPSFGLLKILDWSKVAQALQPRAQVLEALSPQVLPAVQRPHQASLPQANLNNILSDQIRQTLGMSKDAPLDGSKTLLEMGLDSMMAVDLRNRLNELLNITIPMVVIMQGPTFDELLDNVTSLTQSEPSPTSQAPHEDPIKLLRALVREALGFDAEATLREDQTLLELGLDSMMAVEIRNQLNERLGINLPMVAIMQGPTLPELEAAVQQSIEEGSSPMSSLQASRNEPNHPEGEVDTAFERLVLTHTATFGVGAILATAVWWLLSAAL